MDCTVDVPPSGAPFTLHVHNAGTSERGVARGCGDGVPIVIDTPSGNAALYLATTGGLVCDQDGSCESAYQGKVSTLCSDCGLGHIDVLAPGDTKDYPWDHVGRIADRAPAACSGVAGGASCLRAIAVAPTATQTGTLSYCSTGSISFSGGCDADTLTLTFTVDTTQAEATIDLP